MAATVSGRWVGYYLQGGREYPITADLLQAEERLSGFMYDGEPDRSRPLSQFTAEAGLPPGADERIEAQLREMAPEAPAGEIRYVSHLPPNSILQGTRKGPTVSFRKMYQGVSYGGYQVGERLLVSRNADHVVHYEGQLTPDGRVIDGRWWIDARPDEGGYRTEGLFRLHRSEDGGPSPTPPAPRSAGGKRPWWKFWS
jgi:hypothetical protein